MSAKTVVEPFAPFLESKGWKWFSISALVYFAWRVLCVLMGWMRFCGKHCCRAKMQAKNRMANLYNKGGDSWAVVSGGSDGIGLAMCHNLAKQGFNICMVSRNQDKMTQKLTVIE